MFSPPVSSTQNVSALLRSANIQEASNGPAPVSTLIL